MADQPSAQDTGADRTRPAEATTGTPRWVKVFAIIGVAVVLLIVVMLLTGHGPGRHMHRGLGGTTVSSLSFAGVTAVDGA
jgi:hypothetical protein